MRQPWAWDIKEVQGMCEGWDEERKRGVADPELVKKGERAALEMFKTAGVNECLSRPGAEKDPEGNIVEVKWVRVSKGSQDDP